MPNDESVLQPRTRELARAAVRAELAHIAVELMLRKGYDAVTVTELAQAAGVSRSTFLRYLGSKEVAVLDALLLERERVIDELAARPHDEDPLTAIRRSFDSILARGKTANALQLTRLVNGTPGLLAARLERQAKWGEELATVLMTRPSAPASRVQAEALAAAAIGCLSIAIDYWTASDGREPLSSLVDEAFASLSGAPSARRRSR